MNPEMQISRLLAGVDALIQCVTSMDGALFLEKLNGWSPRDIVAHLIGWNRYVIAGSEQIRKGELPFYDIDCGENYSRVNAVLVRDYPSTDKRVMIDELRASARELQSYLQSLGVEEWGRDYGVRHRGATITIQNTVDELIEDYAHHRRQIEGCERPRC